MSTTTAALQHPTRDAKIAGSLGRRRYATDKVVRVLCWSAAAIGLFFLASCFTAIGIFASSLTDSQIVAFLIAVFLCFIVFIGFEQLATFDAFGALQGPIQAIGIQQHYESRSRGVIDLRDVLYFLGVNTVFLLATRTVIQRRTW
jgi:ABC-2 type transport system permease protein